MKLALDIYTQRTTIGQEAAIRQAARVGFEYIHYDIAGIEDELDFIKSPSEYGKNIRRIMDESGVKCSLAHAPYFLRYGQKFDTSEVQYLEIVRAFEMAAELGCGMMVVHSISVPQDVDFKEYNLAFYRSLIPYAEKYGVKVAVENLYIANDGKIVGGKLANPDEMLDFMAELPSEHFTVCLDLGHAFLTGTDPAEFIRALGDKIGTIHLHDNCGLLDDHTIPGLGKIDWVAVRGALREIGYKGVLNYELSTYFGNFNDDDYESAAKLAFVAGGLLLC
ncbi:MAG: sugar phosphate isomerase/epimerase [Clostridia bacterium]|nr:sugar phosphate isomerase/epimerase [Clostridia bacterium]